MNRSNDITDVEFKAFLGSIITMVLMPLTSYIIIKWNEKTPLFGDVFEGGGGMNFSTF